MSRSNSPLTMPAAAYIFGLSTLIMGIQPLLTGVLIKSGLDVSELGLLSGLMLGVGALTSASVPFWIRGAALRRIAFGAALAATALLIACPLIGIPHAYYALFALLGGIMALMGSVAFAILGDTEDPTRGYAVATLMASLLAVGAGAPLSIAIIPAYGPLGAFLTLAAIIATACLACLWLPQRPSNPTTSLVSGSVAIPWEPAVIWRVGAGLVSLAMFNIGAFAFWFFMERLGVWRGEAESVIGIVVSLCGIASIISTFIVAAAGRRLSTLTYLLVGLGFTAVSYIFLLAPGHLFFVLGCLIYSLGLGVTGPGYLAFIREIDSTNRLFVVVPAASSVGAISGAGGAGLFIARFGYSTLLMICLASLILASVFVGVAVLLRARLPGGLGD